MFNKKVSLILILMLIMTSLSACDSSLGHEVQSEQDENLNVVQIETEKILTWNIGISPKTIDPGLNATVDGANIINNTFEGLMREKSGKLEPAMAESYDISEDGKVYTFVLKDNVKWSDGKPVTAYDFEYEWSRVSDPASNSNYYKLYDEVGLKSWEAIDDKTFRVELIAPTPYFLGLTTMYMFFPARKDMVETTNNDGEWAFKPDTAISNGPFCLESYSKNEGLTLVPNEYYWARENVKIDKIVCLMIANSSEALRLYEAGDIDVLDKVNTDEIPRLIAEEPTFMILPQDGTYYYTINTKIEPLNDVRIRKALSLAIDRQSIADFVTKAGEDPAHSLIPSNHTDSEGHVFNEVTGTYGIAYDSSKVSEAQMLFAEAGYPDGMGFPIIEILSNSDETYRNVGEAIKEMWEKNLNINVTLAELDWSKFQDVRVDGDFQIARCGWIGDYSDPMTYLGLFVPNNDFNYSNWENEEYTRLLHKSRFVKGRERDDLLYAADKILSESYINLPIYHYTNPVMVSDKISGWEIDTRSCWYFGDVKIVD